MLHLLGNTQMKCTEANTKLVIRRNADSEMNSWNICKGIKRVLLMDIASYLEPVLILFDVNAALLQSPERL